MVALPELQALTRRQIISTPTDPEDLADAATIFLCAEYYVSEWLEAAHAETGRIQLRDALTSLQTMRDDLLSMRYDPEWLGAAESVRVAAAQQTLLRAMGLLEQARA